MAEYIDREEYCEKHCRCSNEYCDKESCPIWKAPAADVAPVVHGRWAHLGGDEWCCSACGFVITTEGSWDKPTKKHCEDCSARMDGDSDAVVRRESRSEPRSAQPARPERAKAQKPKKRHPA